MMNQDMPTTRKKVLFLITKATFGGAQRYVYDLATNLPQNEFETGVAFGVKGKLTEMLGSKGIPMLEIPSLNRDISLTTDARSFFEIRQAIRDARPDILHVNSSKAAALGALAGRLEGVRTIIFTAHGWPFKESRNIISKAILFLISYFTALCATHVIVVSKTDETIGQMMVGAGHKMVHIPLGREQLNLASPQDGFREMFGSLNPPYIKPDTIRIVSIAELTRNKGIRFAIDAIDELVHKRGKDCVYVVAGEGEERDNLVAHMHARSLSDNIFFPGFIPDAARYLSGFDVYLLPSLKEGMPYVLIEASLAGLPIVATTVIDRDLADQLSQTRLIHPMNSVEIADAISEMATRSRTAQTIENRFPLPDMLARTLELYRHA